MAGRALCRCGLVEENVLTIYRLDEGVAACTAYVGMNAFQLECCSGVVIERGWFPLVRGVASVTKRNCRGVGELPSVDIAMAVFALGRRRLEVNVHHRQFEIWWLMTVGTRYRPMRAN